MKTVTVRICFLPLSLVLLVSTQKLSAQQNAVEKEKTYGDFYFRVGPSGMPVYPRGVGNNEHWETGVNLKLEYKKTEFYFAPMIVGAATFDNPDRFQFLAGVSYKLPRRFSLQTFLFDAYSLNNIPPVDPKARRPTSSVNSLWLGGGWYFEKYQNQVSIFARYSLKSNEPIFYTHFTEPYARWHFGMVSESKLIENTHLILKPEIYISNHINMARAILNLGIERQLHGKLIIGGYYTVYRNLGIPNGATDYRGLPLRKTADRLFFGFRVPFGDSH
ncbi:MAG: hypothetical protein HYX20_03375 [Candidatus Yanofskybacteria bacterium]|nr:hypothetical protein [Candidatus Yanofskybacteria bacterium]